MNSNTQLTVVPEIINPVSILQHRRQTKKSLLVASAVFDIPHDPVKNGNATVIAYDTHICSNKKSQHVQLPSLKNVLTRTVSTYFTFANVIQATALQMQK